MHVDINGLLKKNAIDINKENNPNQPITDFFEF